MNGSGKNCQPSFSSSIPATIPDINRTRIDGLVNLKLCGKFDTSHIGHLNVGEQQ